MLSETPFSADSVPSFPNNTVCLTYDDGPGETGYPATAPGPHSLELARYLASEGVQATFFMVGRQLQQFPGIAAAIGALGHQVGCHTYDHLALDEYHTGGGDVVRQMALTCALLPNDIDAPVYLRAPYGQWSPAVAQAMNADLLTCLNCFGPIHWDNSNSSDWDKWLANVPPPQVAQQYLDDIHTMGKGIILMHDNTANMGQLRKKNMGLALTRILVPQLESAGYNLARVDAVAGIASEAQTPVAFALGGANHLYVSPQGGGGGQILVSGAAPSSWERLTAIALGSNRYALQAPGGQHFSVQNTGDNPVTATGDEIGDWEIFEAAPWTATTTVFRTFTGNFLTIGAGGGLFGNGAPADPNSAFSAFVYPAAASASAASTA